VNGFKATPVSWMNGGLLFSEFFVDSEEDMSVDGDIIIF